MLTANCIVICKINTMEKLNLEEKKRRVFDFVVQCPFNIPLANCPAKKLRVLAFEECEAMIIDSMENEVDEIIALHQQCCYERER